MLVLPAEITHASARTCARMLAQALRSQEHTVVADASALQKFDSSALAVLLECRREAQIQGKSFSVRGLPERLRNLAALYGVAQLLPAAP
ncbi:MAG: STAS domain-containing protein [Brachymonas sp.]|nr:STAS domain-containing protein [Brachymonas sp.]NJS35192.1 STAS domain-containing protein [Brachymonas sp.]